MPHTGVSDRTSNESGGFVAGMGELGLLEGVWEFLDPRGRRVLDLYPYEDDDHDLNVEKEYR